MCGLNLLSRVLGIYFLFLFGCEIYSAWLMIYSLDARQMSWSFNIKVVTRLFRENLLHEKLNNREPAGKRHWPATKRYSRQNLVQVLAKEKKKDSEH